MALIRELQNGHEEHERWRRWFDIRRNASRTQRHAQSLSGSRRRGFLTSIAAHACGRSATVD
jgi:hypothetical protein